jgi:hypothetical protein
LSGADRPKAPFVISMWPGDGEEIRIPAVDQAELYDLLARLSRVCREAGTRSPAMVVWRLDRGEPRPMSRAELEEGDIARDPILAD